MRHSIALFITHVYYNASFSSIIQFGGKCYVWLKSDKYNRHTNIILVQNAMIKSNKAS